MFLNRICVLKSTFLKQFKLLGIMYFNTAIYLELFSCRDNYSIVMVIVMSRSLHFYQCKGEWRKIPNKLTVSINTDGIQLHGVSPTREDHLSSHHRLSQLYDNIISNCRQLPTYQLHANW